MKIKFELDLNKIYSEEIELSYNDGAGCGDNAEYSLNQVFKNEIQRGIESQIRNQLDFCSALSANKDRIDSLIKELEKKAFATIESATDEVTKKYTVDWLESGIAPTVGDDGKLKDVNVKQVIEDKFSMAMNRQVDGSGSFDPSHYVKRYTLIDYVATKHVNKLIEENIPNIDRELNKKISAYMNKKADELLAKKINEIVSSSKD